MRYIFYFMSLMFLGFAMFISSIVLFYRGDYIEGDYNINCFIYLVLAFVASRSKIVFFETRVVIPMTKILIKKVVKLTSVCIIIIFSNDFKPFRKKPNIQLYYKDHLK